MFRSRRLTSLASERKTKIAYLFGAGATHAELLALNPELVRETHGLLISDVSARVIQKARADLKYVSDLETVSGTSGSPIEKASGTSGSLNIELLISLIENSKIHDWASKTARLKRWVEKDIKHILTRGCADSIFTELSFGFMSMK